MTHRREFLTTLTAAATATFLPSTIATAQTPTPSADKSTKESVLGFGGFFFRAHDPNALAEWYRDHLGIPTSPQAPTDPIWTEQPGPTLFTPFPETTKYFGDPAKQFMLNFRVRDLKAMTVQLEAAGIAVKQLGGSDTTGYFAHLHDPEGNPIELWQPAGK